MQHVHTAAPLMVSRRIHFQGHKDAWIRRCVDSVPYDHDVWHRVFYLQSYREKREMERERERKEERRHIHTLTHTVKERERE